MVWAAVSFAAWWPTAKVSEQVNRKCPHRNMMVQLLTSTLTPSPQTANPQYFTRTVWVTYLLFLQMWIWLSGAVNCCSHYNFQLCKMNAAWLIGYLSNSWASCLFSGLLSWTTLCWKFLWYHCSWFVSARCPSCCSTNSVTALAA